MAFTASVADLWKIFETANRRKAESKAAAVEWLSAEYRDLQSLTEVWFDICESLETAMEQQRVLEALDIIRRGRRGPSQSLLAGRLDGFYRSASMVLGNKDKDMNCFHGRFIQSLGCILAIRAKARHTYDVLLPAEITSTLGANDGMGQMREYAMLLQKEVASLQVLIETYKAQR
jgi:hypothetical protein